MLVLSRKLHQRIRLGPQIVVTVLQVTKGRVRLGIEAPPEVAVWREELAAAAPSRPNEARAPAESSVGSLIQPSGAANPPPCC